MYLVQISRSESSCLFNGVVPGPPCPGSSCMIWTGRGMAVAGVAASRRERRACSAQAAWAAKAQDRRVREAQRNAPALSGNKWNRMVRSACGCTHPTGSSSRPCLRGRVGGRRRVRGAHSATHRPFLAALIPARPSPDPVLPASTGSTPPARRPARAR
jgi:hypothetical protein